MDKLRLECAAPGPDVWATTLERMRGNLELEDLEAGEEFDTADGATGRITECKGNLLRFTWQEPDWPTSSRVTLALKSGVLSIEHEGLPTAATAWYESFWQDELPLMAT